jgi:hypothetical protein
MIVYGGITWFRLNLGRVIDPPNPNEVASGWAKRLRTAPWGETSQFLNPRQLRVPRERCGP